MSLNQGAASYFPWRGWAFCCVGNKELFADYVNQAVFRSGDYGMNLLEFHDYTCPGGIVDAIITYRDFERLNSNLSELQRQENYAYLRELAQKVKNQGLELNCWYHVFRHSPDELVEVYPEAQDVDSNFVWDFVTACINEFFDLLPEVDRLTLTSLHETPSIMKYGGSMSREDRLLKLYLTIYNACKSHGKGLVIRDFIVKDEDFSAFLSIMDRLPGDIVIMTKEVLADWTHLRLPLNPYLMKYMGRNLVVEMDVYGEYWGRLDVPCCIPEYIHRVIRGILPFKPLGITARVIHDDATSQHFRTIFDSPNDINLYVLSRFLRDPGYRVAPGRPWHGDYAQMDTSIWIEWARAKYGEEAAAQVVRALRRTEEIIRLTLDAAGVYDQVHSRLPKVLSQEHFGDQSGLEKRLDKAGIEMLRNEKDEALHLAERSFADIEGAAGALKPDDYRQLKALFEGVIFVVRAFRARLEMTYFRKEYRVFRSEEQGKALVSVCSDAEQLANAIRARFGDKFYGGLANTLEQLAEEAREVLKEFV